MIIDVGKFRQKEVLTYVFLKPAFLKFLPLMSRPVSNLWFTNLMMVFPFFPILWQAEISFFVRGLPCTFTSAATKISLCVSLCEAPVSPPPPPPPPEFFMGKNEIP